MGLMPMLVGLLIAFLVATDANRRDWTDYRFCNRTWKWIVAAILIPPVTGLVYLRARNRVPLKSPSAA